MFFTIDGQKIEIGSYCRKFPPAFRSAAVGPAPVPWAGPSAAVSYFFVQFLLQIFPYSRRDPFGNGLWDFPLFRPVSPGFSPENRSVFRSTFQRTPKNSRKILPAGPVRPSVVFVPRASFPAGSTIRLHRFCFSSLSTKWRPFLFGTSSAFPGFPLSAAGCLTRNPPTHCTICPFFALRSCRRFQIGGELHSGSPDSSCCLLGFCWAFPRGNGPGRWEFSRRTRRTSLPVLWKKVGISITVHQNRLCQADTVFSQSIVFLLSCSVLHYKTAGFFVYRIFC